MTKSFKLLYNSLFLGTQKISGYYFLMERDQIRKNELSPPRNLRVSETVQTALELAWRGSPSGVVDTSDFIVAISKTPGRGSDLLRVIALSRQNQFEQEVAKIADERRITRRATGKQTQNAKHTPELVELLASAASISGENPISTDMVVLADMVSSSSVVKEAITRANIRPQNTDVIGAIIDRITYKEEGSIVLEGIDVTQISRSSQTGSNLSEQIEVAPQAAKDLLIQAKEGKLNGVVIRPKWVTEVIASVDKNPVTVLVTDSTDDAEDIVRGTASQLSRDRRKLFGVGSFVMVGQDEYEQNSNTSFERGISEGMGGVLYIPNLHEYQGDRNLRLALSGKKLKIITHVTESDWKKLYGERIYRGVKPIFPEPPTVEETQQILKKKRRDLEEDFRIGDFKIHITSASIEEAARLADRYYRDVSLPPGGAKRLLERAATNIKINNSQMLSLHDKRVRKDTNIDPADVRIALEQLTGIEVKPEDARRYLDMEKDLKKRVTGQNEAITAISEAIRRAKAGLKNPKQPIGRFIFMGPSGVGKTESSKALAEFLFGSEEEIITLDMSEYMEKHTVSRMIGAPPGYVGYEEGGQLTEAVRKRPYRVILFDEIEKAHRDVQNVLLQLLDEGRLTDGQGRSVDFRNTVVIMTGNVGSEFYRLENELGSEKVKNAVLEEIKDPEKFRPEFLNRVDKIIVFNSLDSDDLKKIVDIQISGVNRKLAEQGLSLTITNEVKEFLASTNVSSEYGARPLVRAISQLIETPLSLRILEGKMRKNSKVAVTLKNGKIEIESLKNK